MEDDLPNDVHELKRIVQKAKKAAEDAVAAKKAAEDAVAVAKKAAEDAVEAEKARAASRYQKQDPLEPTCRRPREGPDWMPQRHPRTFPDCQRTLLDRR
jgi:hypothetical protein